MVLVNIFQCIVQETTNPYKETVMIRRLIILLLIVGCGTEPTSTNICVSSSLHFPQTYCYDWTDSEDTCTISGLLYQHQLLSADILTCYHLSKINTV